MGLFAKVGPATATYDFERDEPAWRSAASTRGRAEVRSRRPRAAIVRSGERLALRVPGGMKTLTLRLRLLRGAAPVEPAPLGIATVARGGATTAQAGVEVPFAKVDRPSSAEKAFATAAFDLPVPLNASAPRERGDRVAPSDQHRAVLRRSPGRDERITNRAFAHGRVLTGAE